MQIIFRRCWPNYNLPDARLDVEASDPIDAILARTAKIAGSPVEQFSLWNSGPDENCFRLENRKTLSDYQIGEGGTVTLRQEFNIIIVHASYASTLFILKVEASQSIYHVKLLIAVKENINWHCIRLGVGPTVMEDNKCVLNYRLKADSRVWLAMVDDSEASSSSDT